MKNHVSIPMVVLHLILGIITGGLWWIGLAIYVALKFLKVIN